MLNTSNIWTSNQFSCGCWRFPSVAGDVRNLCHRTQSKNVCIRQTISFYSTCMIWLQGAYKVTLYLSAYICTQFCSQKNIKILYPCFFKSFLVFHDHLELGNSDKVRNYIEPRDFSFCSFPKWLGWVIIISWKL